MATNKESSRHSPPLRIIITFGTSFLLVFLAAHVFDWISGESRAVQDQPQAALEEAISEGERFMDAHPDDIESILMLAGLYGHAENSDRQIHWAQKAVDLERGRVEGWVLLGNGYGLANRMNEAERAFQTALSIDPCNHAALQGLEVIGSEAQCEPQGAHRLLPMPKR